MIRLLNGQVILEVDMNKDKYKIIRIEDNDWLVPKQKYKVLIDKSEDKKEK